MYVQLCRFNRQQGNYDSCFLSCESALSLTYHTSSSSQLDRLDIVTVERTSLSKDQPPRTHEQFAYKLSKRKREKRKTDNDTYRYFMDREMRWEAFETPLNFVRADVSFSPSAASSI